jgi:site-specific DNA recombinase
MRIAVYVRVSTLQQASQHTIEQQLERLQEYCRSQEWSWNNLNVFRDEGYSGATLKRPGLDQLRDRVAHAEFDRLLMTAPDRLARKYVHQVLLLEECEQAGCHVEFADHPMSQDPHDQLLLQIRGAVAEYERTLITERMRRGRLQKYQTGQLLPWTQPPYGYRLDPDHPRMPEGVRLDLVEAAVVAEIFTGYLEVGQSLAGLATRLMQQGIPTPRGGRRWMTASLRRILSNPAYMGVVYASRGRVRPIKRRRSPLAPVGKRANSSHPQSPEHWIRVGEIPAIVTQSQFDQVQEKLALNQQRARRNNHAHQYLLRSLVSCGLCRLSCTGQTRRTYSYYTCVGKAHPSRSSRDEICRSRLIPMHQLDELVWTDLCQVVVHPEVLTQALERAQGGEWLPQDLQARRENLRKARGALTNQIERLTDAYLDQIMSLEEYRRRRQQLEERLEALYQQERHLEVQVQSQDELAAMAMYMEEFCQRVQQGLAQATFEQKRQLVELLIDRVVVTNEDVEIRYVLPIRPKGERSSFYLLHVDYCRTLSSHAQSRVPAV